MLLDCLVWFRSNVWSVADLKAKRIFFECMALIVGFCFEALYYTIRWPTPLQYMT